MFLRSEGGGAPLTLLTSMPPFWTARLCIQYVFNPLTALLLHVLLAPQHVRPGLAV